MSTLVIKDMPEALHARLRERARRNHRSQNKEAIAIIEHELHGAFDPAQLSAPLELAGGYRPSFEDIESDIAKGRE